MKLYQTDVIENDKQVSHLRSDSITPSANVCRANSPFSVESYHVMGMEVVCIGLNDLGSGS